MVHKKKGIERERGGREKLAMKVSQEIRRGQVDKWGIEPTRCNLVAPLATLGRYAPWSP